MGDGLFERIEALQGFAGAAGSYVDSPGLDAARALSSRVGERLALSRAHTVVALAGSTGTGKSSVFNALAGQKISVTGVRRPTTGEAHACVWGPDADSNALLDWLGVTRRHGREVGADPDLAGLVLLDLPDFDSVEPAHRAEADRLLTVVDLVVWVLHPQKYADKLVHRSYLAQFHRHREITVVVLNQADLLAEQDLKECVTDLRRLLAVDGLGEVPVLTASTVGAPGLESVRAQLGKQVAERRAVLRRLEADLDNVVEAVSPLVDAPVPRKLDLAEGLTPALAKAAGAPVVAEATERAYVHRGRKRTGWPLLRWLRKLRPDPLARLHLEQEGATSIGPAAPAAQAAMSLSLRSVADRAAAQLPEPWREPMLAAARSRVDDLPDALDQAVSRVDLGLERPRAWWRLVSGLQWVFAALVVAGALWLLVRYVLFALALPEPPLPQVGRLPLPTAALLGGLLAGLLLSLLARVLVRVGARRRRRRVEARLLSEVDGVARQLVVAPAQRVLDAYAAARESLDQARSRADRKLHRR